jgi:hypothetical protein
VAFVISLLLAWTVKYAFIDSWILVKMMSSYMQVVPTTQITFDLYGKLCGLSTKFKELWQKGGSPTTASAPISQPEASPAPISQPEASPAPISRPETPPASIFQPEASPVPVSASTANGGGEEASATLFCPNCGSRLNATAVFCGSCGAKVAES